MPIDYERFPEIPRGAKLQPTADPDVGYVFADDAATGERTPIGMIRHGVFTPAPPFALVKARADLAAKLSSASSCERPAAAPSAPLFSAPVVATPATPALPGLELPDPFSMADDATDILSAAAAPDTVSVTALLAAAFFSALEGGDSPADAADFLNSHRDFVAALSGVSAAALPERLTPEAFRRFLAILNPREASELLQKTLFAALARRLGKAAAADAPLFFDAGKTALTISVAETNGALALPAGFAYLNAVAYAEGNPAQKAFFKAAIEAGCDWVARLSANDASAAPVAVAAEKALADAGASAIHHGTDRGVFAAAAGAALPKSLQKALPGLASGIVFTRTSQSERLLCAASLPAALPGVKRAAAVVNSLESEGITVFFPAAAAGNAAVILNLAVIGKVAKAVRKNEERRRAIAGLPALTKAEADRFFADPASAAQSTAAFLALV